MKKAYYREQALERIARDVITAYLQHSMSNVT